MNLLIPTDFSENANNAAKYGIELFGSRPCNFYLLNTYTPAIVHSRFMAETLRGSQDAEEGSRFSKEGLQREKLVMESLTNNPEHHFETISSFDILTHKVAETVNQKKIDLIISGTKGASGLKQVFMGSNTVRMIKTVQNCPILAVPKEYSFQIPKHIAFPTDFKQNFSADILEPLLNIAKRFDSEIHIMHIAEENQMDKFQESNRFTLMEYMAPLAHRVHFMPYYTKKSTVIETFLEELKIDMLAQVYHEHGYLDQLFREPVVANIAYNTKIPFLVLSELQHLI